MKALEPSTGKPILAAMKGAEDGVPEPTRRQAGSFASQVAALQVGESLSRAEQMDDSLELGQVLACMPGLAERLRNSMAPNVTRVKADTGHNYRTEVGSMITAGNNLFIVCIVTRTE